MTSIKDSMVGVVFLKKVMCYDQNNFISRYFNFESSKFTSMKGSKVINKVSITTQGALKTLNLFSTSTCIRTS